MTDQRLILREALAVRAYSMDLRERVLADCDAGMATPLVAQKYRVSASWVRRLKQRRRQTGSAAPRQGPPGAKPGHRVYGDQVRGAVQADPDATLVRDLGAAYTAVTGESARTFYAGGTYDAGGPSSFGVPTVTFGAGGGEWPLGTDYVPLSQVFAEARILARLILDTLA